MHSRSSSPQHLAAESTGCPERQSFEPQPLHHPPPAPTQKGGRGGQGGEAGRSKGLSRDDLLFLLSILEGELQARDEVITILKAETMDVALLESHYGVVAPQQVLRALQRDSVQAQACEAQAEQAQLQDVYKQPMAELDHLVETQRQSYRQMLEQLEQVEHSHRGALCRLEEQERNHRAFIQESDDLTNLLEQDRERFPWRPFGSPAPLGSPNPKAMVHSEGQTVPTLDRTKDIHQTPCKLEGTLVRVCPTGKTLPLQADNIHT